MLKVDGEVATQHGDDEVASAADEGCGVFRSKRALDNDRALYDGYVGVEG